MPERRTTKVGVKWGELVFVWENTVDQFEPAQEIKNLSFPNCAHQCAAVKYFGVCECESICSHKFNSDGEPKQLTSGGIDTYA